MNLERKFELQPAPAPVSPAPPPRRSYGRFVLLALLLASAAAGGGYWWMHRPLPLPPGIVASNGRLEMDEIDIQTKFPGRVLDIHVDEGDAVKPGQVLAHMDVADLQAQLARARAMIAQAEQNIAMGQAELEQARTGVKLGGQEVARSLVLVPKGFSTQEKLDQQRQQLDAANATVRATLAQIAAAQAARDAAQHDAGLIEVNIADNTLVSPKQGLIQYRLVNVGEVLPAGGKLYTLLDTHYAYMDVFLPTAEAGLAVPGREARVVLDARPDHPLPAHVVFLAASNQFTPKMVETFTEREKLMFRVRVRIDDAALADGAVQAGMPGMAYIRTGDGAQWPAVAERRQ